MNRARTIAGLAAIGFMLPYVVIKILWLAGMNVGVNDPELMRSPELVSANLLTGGMEAVGLVLALALTRPWGMRVPAWLMLFPIWVGTGLLVPIMVTVPLILIVELLSSHSAPPAMSDVLQPWVYTVVYGGFIGQGIALGVAFVLYALARWPRLLAGRTADRPTRVTHPLQSLLAVMAAVLAVLSALPQLYWAFGGKAGLPVAADAVTRFRLGQGVAAAFAIVAATGLLMLVRKIGPQVRFVVPVALSWVGGGVLLSGGVWLIIGLLLGSSTSDNAQFGVDLLRLTAGMLAGVVAAFLLTERELSVG